MHANIRSISRLGLLGAVLIGAAGARTVTALELVVPAGGESWTAGTTVTLAWNATDPADYVDITVEKDGAWYATIGYVPMAAGQIDWEICPAFGDAADYRIRLAGTTSGGTPVAAVSEAFAVTGSLPKPTLAVTHPAAGETWTAGVRVDITWTSTDPSGGVYIDLLRDGQLYREIGYAPVAGGSFSWRPCTLIGDGDDYSIRLSMEACEPGVEVTGGAFSITGSAPEPTIAATTPASNVIWTGGATRQISWDYANTFGYVRLDVFRNGAWHEYVGYAPITDLLFDWAIDSRIGDDAEYQIRLASPNACGGINEAFSDLFGVRTCDLDRDQDVDLDDFESFVDCFNGPNRPPAPATLTLADCVGFDQDGDADVDLTDFAIFQGCFNGYNRAARCP